MYKDHQSASRIFVQWPCVYCLVDVSSDGSVLKMKQKNTVLFSIALVFWWHHFL